MIINDDLTCPDILNTDISVAGSQTGLDINYSLDDSSTDLDINLKSCKIPQLELVIVEPVIDSTKLIVIGEPVIDSPKLVMISHHKIALQVDDQIADIQTNYKKSALEIVKYSGSKSISDLLGASIKNFDYSQYTKIPIWMEQNHQDDLKNSDDLENQEISEEAVVAEIVMPQNFLIKKMERMISQLHQELHQEFSELNKKINTLETKIDSNDQQVDQLQAASSSKHFNNFNSPSSSIHSPGSSLSVTGSTVQKMIDTQMNAQYQQKLKLAEYKFEQAKMNESIELAKIQLIREQQIKLENDDKKRLNEIREQQIKFKNDEKKRLNEIAEGKRQETEKQLLLSQQLQTEINLRPIIQNSIDIYTNRSKTLQTSLNDFFTRVNLKSTTKKVSKLPLIAHSITTSASSVIGLIPIKWQGRLMALSLVEAFANWGASQLVKAYNSYKISQLNESIYDRFITRLNNVVTTMEPWILDYTKYKSKSYLDSAGPSSTENNPEYSLNLKFSTFNVIPFANLYMTGGAQLGTLLSIGRYEFGPHNNIELQTQLNIATQLCREFILQQSEDTESEKYKLGLNNERDIDNSVHWRIERLSVILAGQIPNANASNFLTSEELTHFKLAYYNYKQKLGKDN
jgi:hypothetical protein